MAPQPFDRAHRGGASQSDHFRNRTLSIMGEVVCEAARLAAQTLIKEHSTHSPLTMPPSSDPSIPSSALAAFGLDKTLVNSKKGSLPGGYNHMRDISGAPAPMRLPTTEGGPEGSPTGSGMDAPGSGQSRKSLNSMLGLPENASPSKPRDGPVRSRSVSPSKVRSEMENLAAQKPAEPGFGVRVKLNAHGEHDGEIAARKYAGNGKHVQIAQQPSHHSSLIVETLRTENAALSKNVGTVNDTLSKLRNKYFKELTEMREKARNQMYGNRIDQDAMGAVSHLLNNEEPIMFFEPTDFILEDLTKDFIKDTVEEKMKLLLLKGWKAGDGDKLLKEAL